MKKELIAHKDPKSPVSEIFRTLRTNIQFMNTNKPLKTLLVTSTLPGEGKSWVASNLSVAFAQAGKRVILIDADMRKGRIYNIFGVLPRPGLSNYLSGVSENGENRRDLGEFLRETEVPNLYVMPAGNVPPNPSELLITPQMISLLEQLKQECDLIIIDGTPSKLVTDAVILSRIVDSTIVVTAHNQTKKEDLQKVIRGIKNVGGNIAGIVYNKIPVSAKKYNETYYYSSISQKTQSSNKSKEEYKPKQDLNIKSTSVENIPNLQKTYKNVENKKNETKKLEVEVDLPKAMKKAQFEEVKIQEPQKTNAEKTREEKTAEVLREFNEYLKNEKRNKYKK